jgi:hypothetical protein
VSGFEKFWGSKHFIKIGNRRREVKEQRIKEEKKEILISRREVKE